MKTELGKERILAELRYFKRFRPTAQDVWMEDRSVSRAVAVHKTLPNSLNKIRINLKVQQFLNHSLCLNSIKRR